MSNPQCDVSYAVAFIMTPETNRERLCIAFRPFLQLPENINRWVSLDDCADWFASLTYDRKYRKCRFSELKKTKQDLFDTNRFDARVLRDIRKQLTSAERKTVLFMDTKQQTKTSFRDIFRQNRLKNKTGKLSWIEEHRAGSGEDYFLVWQKEEIFFRVTAYRECFGSTYTASTCDLLDDAAVPAVEEDTQLRDSSDGEDIVEEQEDDSMDDGEHPPRPQELDRCPSDTEVQEELIVTGDATTREEEEDEEEEDNEPGETLSLNEKLDLLLQSCQRLLSATEEPSSRSPDPSASPQGEEDDVPDAPSDEPDPGSPDAPMPEPGCDAPMPEHSCDAPMLEPDCDGPDSPGTPDILKSLMDIEYEPPTLQDSHSSDSSYVEESDSEDSMDSFVASLDDPRPPQVSRTGQVVAKFPSHKYTPCASKLASSSVATYGAEEAVMSRGYLCQALLTNLGLLSGAVPSHFQSGYWVPNTDYDSPIGADGLKISSSLHTTVVSLKWAAPGDPNDGNPRTRTIN